MTAPSFNDGVLLGVSWKIRAGPRTSSMAHRLMDYHGRKILIIVEQCLSPRCLTRPHRRPARLCADLSIPLERVSPGSSIDMVERGRDG